MNKKNLREDMKNKLASLNEEEKHTKAHSIHKKLFQSSFWINSEIIGITISVGNEIDTYAIIRKAWDEGKKVAVPKCYPHTKELKFFIITSFMELEDSFYGLKEPDPEKTIVLDSMEIDLLFVPGLLFDRQGYRIGYGGGYYDRFLEKNPRLTCSLAFQMQLMKQLPHDNFDVPVRSIITEKEVIIV